MTDDKALTGGQEKIVRAVERTLAAQSRRDQPGVKITNLASGKTQVEVHAYDDDLRTAGDAARDEFDRQMGTTSVPTAEFERMVWLASIGQAALDKGVIAPHESAPNDAEIDAAYEKAYPTLVVEGESDAELLKGMPHDIQAGPGRRSSKRVMIDTTVVNVGGTKRVRKPVATGDATDPNADLLAKLKAATEGDEHA